MLILIPADSVSGAEPIAEQFKVPVERFLAYK